MIKGWDRGVMNMVVGEVRRLQIPPEDGYGADGSPQLGIPPHSTLLLEIELLEAKPKPPLRWERHHHKIPLATPMLRCLLRPGSPWSVGWVGGR
eukprot:SAG31_NODE_243_length_19342_cov_12.906459_8_plen_94_part_00